MSRIILASFEIRSKLSNSRLALPTYLQVYGNRDPHSCGKLVIMIGGQSLARPPNIS